MRSFASDNNSGVHPLVMDAVVRANRDHAAGYGDDLYTKAATDKLKDVFGERAEPFFVFNGTGANSVALQSITGSYNAIICAATAHIYVDECGAPAKMCGCTVIAVPTDDGKLTPGLISPHLHNFGVCHHAQPKAVYISQVSELGTVYAIDEIKAIAKLLHEHGMLLHMDGARLANACAFLNCTMKEATVDAGVDILSFGGTKNGMMMGEAVISFRPEVSAVLPYLRKQSAQLASKMRYLSAQFIPYMENDLWLSNAANANAKAARLAGILRSHPEINFTQKPETNQLFFTMPAEAAKKLSEEYFFYYWNEAASEVRLVTSWDTTDEDIDRLGETLSIIL
ncbi:MAG: aminotransferase class V-fold PLP-dependent enzyme [Tannerellaceae bacterium]|jgi:threonine aldolase|nr:aminotransferase class V-fold PLP-dependent enzyme [Tannerellaceae bacterium]